MPWKYARILVNKMTQFITSSWHQKTKYLILQFNLNCCIKAKELFKLFLNGELAHIYYFLSLVLLILETFCRTRIGEFVFLCHEQVIIFPWIKLILREFLSCYIFELKKKMGGQKFRTNISLSSSNIWNFLFIYFEGFFAGKF